MTNYFYTDTNGRKQGPINDQQLKLLAAQGVIAPHTPLETDSGHKGLASQVHGLFTATPSPSPSTEKQYFCTNCGVIISEQAVACNACGATPTGHNKCCRQCGTAIEPGEIACSICGANVERAKLRGCRSCFTSCFATCVAACVTLSLIIVGGTTAWLVFGTSPLVNALKERLNNEVFSKEPMETTNISVKWTTNKTGYFAADEFSVTDKATEIFHKFVDYDAATGEFNVEAKVTEGLYKLTDYDAALQKLGFTKLYEKEYSDAWKQFQSLPESLKSDLRAAVPQDIAAVRFYEIIVPKYDTVTLTGNVELTKHASGKWLVDRFVLDPFPFGDNFITESNLQEKDYKLDDPQTKEIIASTIRKREKFADAVGPVWKKHQDDETVKAAEETQLKAERDRLARDAQKIADDERAAKSAAEQERNRLVTIQDQIDNFTEFCKPGTTYKGNFTFRGIHNVATFDVNVTFDKYADTDTSKSQVEGTLSIRYPGGTSERPFTVAVNTKEATQYPVKGTIDNSTLPTQEDFMRKSRATSPQDKDDASAFYRLLRNSDRIDIQFTNTMRFTITATSEQGGYPLNLTEADGRRPKVKRSTTTQAVGASSSTQTGSSLTQMGGSQAQAPAMPTGVVSLDEEIRKSGFSDHRALESFVQYGSKFLEEKLNKAQGSYYSADAFDKAAAQKNVDAVQSEIGAAQAAIAKPTFFSEYAISAHDAFVTVHGDRSSCIITIETGFQVPQARGGGVSFPVPSVACDAINSGTGLTNHGTINFSINGTTQSIQELVRNSHHYKARVQIKNLRYKRGGFSLTNVAADLLRVEIIKVVNEPQEMGGGMGGFGGGAGGGLPPGVHILLGMQIPPQRR